MANRPTPADIRKARKAQLESLCAEFELDAEGKVDELRARLIAHVETAAAAEPQPQEEAAPEPAPEGKAVEETEEPEEEAEGEKEGAYAPKLKPKLDASVREALRVRRRIAERRPEFRRQIWFRYQRLGESWRKAQGMQSKVRRHFGYRPNVPSIGYRGPRAARGLHPSGFREVLVRTVRDLEGIDPNVQAARIAGSVGTRRRLEIQAVADEKGIRVLNRREEERTSGTSAGWRGRS